MIYHFSWRRLRHAHIQCTWRGCHGDAWNQCLVGKRTIVLFALSLDILVNRGCMHKIFLDFKGLIERVRNAYIPADRSTGKDWPKDLQFHIKQFLTRAGGCQHQGLNLRPWTYSGGGTVCAHHGTLLLRHTVIHNTCVIQDNELTSNSRLWHKKSLHWVVVLPHITV